MSSHSKPLTGEILIVDDINISLKLLSHILIEAGYIVRTAHSGEQALHSVKLKCPSLILLDIKMPDMDGFEVCQRLKEDARSADIPVIFLSCLQDIEDCIHGFELGAVDYITKPFNSQNVLMRVKAQLNLFNAKQQLALQNAQLLELNNEILQEITKRKAAEQSLKQQQNQLEELVTQRTAALSKANEKYHQLFNQARDGIVLINPDNGMIVDCNAEFERLSGRTLVQLKTLHIWDLRIAEQRELGKSIFMQIKQKGEIHYQESIFQHPDGTTLTIECAAKVIPFGEDYIMQSITRDVSERKRIEAQRQQSEERFYNLFNAMHEGFHLAEVVFNEQGKPVDWRFLEANPVTARFIGLPRDELIGRSIRDIFPNVDIFWFDIPIETALSGKAVHVEKFCEISQRYYDIHYYSASYGQVACIVGDITKRKQMENALRDSEARYARVIEGSDQGFWDWNLQTQQVNVSARFESILGYNTGEISFNRQHWSHRVHPDDCIKTLLSIEQHIAGKSPKYEMEMRCLTKTGEWKWLLMRGQIVERDELGKPLIMSGTSTDISQRKQAEAKIWQQANYDELTGLPNRSMFYDRFEQEIKKARRRKSALALLFIDLDKFKDVNDSLGHLQGDVLLTQVAQRLLLCVRSSDTVARLGGDEFTVILPDLESSGRGIDRVAQAIIDSLSEAFYLDDDVAFISASIGITLYPHDDTQIDTLLCNADQAMYAAKALGRGCFHYFTPALQAAAQRRLSLSNDLHHALSNNQFRIYYQPIVELNPQRIIKAEALIRWQHPQHGLISPSEFIPLAEETGMIIEIGDWVFKEAARQVKHFRQLYNPNFQISINKSPLQFRNDNVLFNSWLPYLNQLGLSGDSIVIEITEGVLLDVEENVTKKLFAFRDAGIQVALDDFGTGYCALAYLNRFDIDYLKIDKSFVDKIAIKSNDLILCEAIIMMAHKLGLKVIAEGVETDEQCLLLTDIGCDYGQGYLFSKPLAIDEFELLLQRSIL